MLLEAIRTFRGRLQTTGGRKDSWFRLQHTDGSELGLHRVSEYSDTHHLFPKIPVRVLVTSEIFINQTQRKYVGKYDWDRK